MLVNHISELFQGDGRTINPDKTQLSRSNVRDTQAINSQPQGVTDFSKSPKGVQDFTKKSADSEGDATGYGGGAVSSSPSDSRGFGSNMASAASQMQGLSGVPGLGIGAGVLGNMLDGNSWGKTAIDAAKSTVGTVSGLLGPAGIMGGFASTGLAENPAQAMSGYASGLVGSMIGGAIAGPVGAVLGGFGGTALGNAAYGAFKDAPAATTSSPDPGKFGLDGFSLNSTSTSNPDPGKFSGETGVSTLDGGAATVGLTDDSKSEGGVMGSMEAGISNPGSTVDGLAEGSKDSRKDGTSDSLSGMVNGLADSLGGMVSGLADAVAGLLGGDDKGKTDSKANDKGDASEGDSKGDGSLGANDSSGMW